MKHTLRLLFLLLFPLAPAALLGQSYLASSITYNPDPFAGGNPVAPMGDDNYSSVIPLPFPFCFYDSTFNHVVVGSNGVVTFDTSVALGYCPWPISMGLPFATGMGIGTHSIFTPIQDIFPGSGGSVNYGTYGVAPYRRFVISYDSVPMFSCNNLYFTQQVILYEKTNVIEVHIANKPLCAQWNNGYAILGLQKDTTDYYEVPGRTVPAQWTTQNEAWRFSPAGGLCWWIPETDTVSGKVYLDLNANCTLDGTDFGLPNVAVLANGGAYYDWTDLSGYYEMLLDTGTWNITHFLPGPAATLCPASGSYTVSFTNYANHSANNDFADTVDVLCPDLWVDIGTFNLTRCQHEVVNVAWCNYGYFPDSNVVVTITLHDSLTIDSASVPLTSLGGNSWAINVGTLPMYQCGSAQIYISVGCDTAGTIYCMNASISGTHADCDTANNAAADCHPLSAPVDPNDKQVAAQDMAHLGWVARDTIDPDDRLVYMIRFQNTGTDVAQTVVLRDTLDGLLLPETVQPGASSHNYRWFVANGVLVVEFPNIMLPDSGADFAGSQGYVKFRVNQRPGNGPGDVIRNSAAIYFDFEAPVITNTTENILRLPVSTARPLQGNVKVYPNPGRDQIVVEWPADAPATLVLHNVVGQEVGRWDLQHNREQLHLDGLAPGVYLWRLDREGLPLATGKWVRVAR